VIGAGAVIFLISAHVVSPAPLTTTTPGLQDAKIGMLEHQADFSSWFDNPMAKGARQYGIDRENGR
jgi:hypothetical protein